MGNDTYVLVMPSMKHRAAAVDYINEFIKSGDDIDGLGLDGKIATDYDAYGEWFYWLYGEDNKDCNNEKNHNENGDSRKEEPSFTYFYIEESTGKIVGTVNIRRNSSMAEKYGNLGYAIRPTLRGKGFGTDMVEAAVSLCGFMGMNEITAVCRKDNKPGLRLLEKCGFLVAEENELWLTGKICLP